MAIYPKAERFLKQYCPSDDPLLLALSGGPDSMCLFCCLLLYRDKWKLPFHIAHIDHGWRPESSSEATILEQLANEHQVPFHLKKLNPSLLTGNLEAACRDARYQFFSELGLNWQFQGVLTGHHQNDQAETVFKRILEGSHWSRWKGLQPESYLKGMRILRPLLSISKAEIILEASNYFDDYTNRSTRFLRARIRESIFPSLNKTFGKEVEQSFLEISKEAGELTQYFEKKLHPLVQLEKLGPFGHFYDLMGRMPQELIEIKQLIRLICGKKGFFLSREQTEQAAKALKDRRANVRFISQKHRIEIDRERIFILEEGVSLKKADPQVLEIGNTLIGNWNIEVEEGIYLGEQSVNSWKEGWLGTCCCHLPCGTYSIGFQDTINSPRIKKRWNQAKVPAFVYDFFPVIWGGGEQIYGEFLTGKRDCALMEGDKCLRVKLEFKRTKD